MQIEIWSDFACPFCYIGKRRFEKALAAFEHRDQVQVVYRSFELDPHSPKHVPHDVYDMLSGKYGMSRQEAIKMNQNLAQQAAADGLDFRFAGLVLTNTFDAHRLRHFAEKAGKAAEVSELLFRAYFSENKNVSDHETLADIAVAVGLDRNEALSMLAGEQFSDRVRAEEADGRSLGIRGVPYYIIDRKQTLSGAQQETMFLKALQQAWGDRQPLEGSDVDGDSCIDGICAVPEEK
ncbi:DsbA family oxidoreductase [Paenibacillus lignilyticus]|uniref:DsbA family oxidoreductase n=1 Tax=Paenibacillus lignilyticus TaxID=1172615 RepID=A0ABS5CL98_9BACL|nr:DsbA family oxidoreductase [Paenibacillus lignilyticus]MBP3966638.1 DsbA family oxidoreductase [Paenibacillus lignilyticus]